MYANTNSERINSAIIVYIFSKKSIDLKSSAKQARPRKISNIVIMVWWSWEGKIYSYW